MEKKQRLFDLLDGHQLPSENTLSFRHVRQKEDWF